MVFHGLANHAMYYLTIKLLHVWKCNPSTLLEKKPPKPHVLCAV
jgi:hypothetical protein